MVLFIQLPCLKVLNLLSTPVHLRNAPPAREKQYSCRSNSGHGEKKAGMEAGEGSDGVLKNKAAGDSGS